MYILTQKIFIEDIIFGTGNHDRCVYINLFKVKICLNNKILRFLLVGSSQNLLMLTKLIVVNHVTRLQSVQYEEISMSSLPVSNKLLYNLAAVHMI